MRPTSGVVVSRASALLSLLLLLLLVVAAVVDGEATRGDDLASRPRQGRLEEGEEEKKEGQGRLPPHPLYDSLPQDNRRVLTLGEADDLPNEVFEAYLHHDPYGDTVSGYKLPNSFSSAPSYADPSLLSAVMQQADQANFRYPIVTTVPPGPDQTNPSSEEVAEPTAPQENEINPFQLFPPQFHELLEIPLHTYSNGSSFNTHDRFRPVGPLISKGYASTKIQGNTNSRTQTGQDTPQVVFKPKPVFNETTKPQRKHQASTTVTSTTTESTRPSRKPTEPPSTEPPISRTRPITQRPRVRSTTQSYPSRLSSLPFRPLPTGTTHKRPPPRDTAGLPLAERPSRPSVIPPLRYTRRPYTRRTTRPPYTSRPTTTPYATRPSPTTPRPFTTPRPTTTPQPTTTPRHTTTPHPTTKPRPNITTWPSTTPRPTPTTYRSTQRTRTTTEPNLRHETFEVPQRPTAAQPDSGDVSFGTRIPSRPSQPRPTPSKADVRPPAEKPHLTREEVDVRPSAEHPRPIPVEVEERPPVKQSHPTPAEVDVRPPVKHSRPTPAEVDVRPPVKHTRPTPTEVSVLPPVQQSRPTPAEVSVLPPVQQSRPTPAEVDVRSPVQQPRPTPFEVDVRPPVKHPRPTLVEVDAPPPVEQPRPIPFEVDVRPPIEQPRPRPGSRRHPPSATPPQPSLTERRDEDKTFRPSKVDPFLPSGRPAASRLPSAGGVRPGHFAGSRQPPPPAVNTFEPTTWRPPTYPTINPLLLTSSPDPPLTSLPPQSHPPIRPFISSLPIPARRPALPSIRPSLQPAGAAPPLLRPPPPHPQNLPTPSHLPQPLAGPAQPSKPQFPVRASPPALARPVADWPSLPPAALGPPPRQRVPQQPRPAPPAGPQTTERPRQEVRPFQIVPSGLSPPLPQEVADQPDSGFTLPQEAGNLPTRPTQDENLIRPRPDDAGPNVLPQFRPNAPPQQETFGFQDPPARVFNVRPRPLRPDGRPVLSKRPPFLENFNFFGRSPVNRRRGETGPLAEANSASNKVVNRRKATTKGVSVQYQLTHGSVPKHAQKVVLIGPFQQPPPGAPIITLPDRDLPPPVTPDDPLVLPPPPPPPPPFSGHRLPPPPPRVPTPTTTTGQRTRVLEGKAQAPLSKRTYRGPAGARDSAPPLPSPQALVQKPQKQSSPAPADTLTKKAKKKVPLVVYGRLVDPTVYAAPVDNTQTDVSTTVNVTEVKVGGAAGTTPQRNSTTFSRDVPVTNHLEEVSEEHKEAIIAGKIRFPPSGVERSGEGGGGRLPPGIIPVPVPILPQQRHPSRRPLPPKSSGNSFWSFLGFGDAKPKPVAADRRVMVASPAAKNSASTPLKTRPHPARANRPVPHILLPPPPTPPRPRLASTSVPPPVYTSSPPTTTPAHLTTPSTPRAETDPSFITASTPHSPKPTEPRPVYKHTTTERTTTAKTSTTNPTENPLLRSTAPPATIPNGDTEYRPHKLDTQDQGTIIVPGVQSSSYDGWRVVGEPVEGVGAALSPVVSYVRENTPEIIIRGPTPGIIDEEVVTGVISDRMGEVEGDQMVQFSSKLNVETPGIVRSYWIEPPVLA